MYLYVWVFDVRSEHRAEFERVYGPNGDWVELFGRAAGHRSTRLVRLRDDRYVTIDEWENRSHYDAFRTSFAVDYERLDERSRHMTVAEERLLTLDGDVVEGPDADGGDT